MSDAELRSILSSKLFLRRLDEQRQRDFTFQIMLAPILKQYQDRLPNLLNISFDSALDSTDTERLALWGSYTRTENRFTYIPDYTSDDIDSASEEPAKVATGVRSEVRMGAWFQHLIPTSKFQIGLFSRMGVTLFSSNWDVERGTTVRTLGQIDGPAFLAIVGMSRVPLLNEPGSIYEFDVDYFHGSKLSGKSLNGSYGWRFPYFKKGSENQAINSLLDVFARIQTGSFRASNPFDDQTENLSSNSLSIGTRVQLK